MEIRDNRLAAGALLLVAGGIIGAGLTLLLAPQSGERTRRDIYRRAKRVKSRADEVVEDIADNISDMVETIGEKTDDLLESGKEVAGSARKNLIKMIEDGAEKLDKLRAKLSRA